MAPRFLRTGISRLKVATHGLAVLLALNLKAVLNKAMAAVKSTMSTFAGMFLKQLARTVKVALETVMLIFVSKATVLFQKSINIAQTAQLTVLLKKVINNKPI